MKVLLLVHGLPVGGTEVMVCHLARRLRALGNDVVVECLDSIGDLGQRLQAEGFEVEAHGRKPGFDVALVRRLAAGVRRHGADVVHAHQYTCFFYAALARLLAPAPLVFTEHGRFYPDLPSARRRLFNRLMRRKADHITAVSRGVKASLVDVEGFDPRRIEVVYNGIDLERLARPSTAARAEARARFDLPPAAEVIGTVGRLDPIKNQPLLLNAFARLAARRPGAHLAIAGDGPEMEKLRGLAASLGIAARTRFLGQQGDIARVFAALDAFALTSFSEGTPMTVIEAMASSTPIVSTAVGGIPEIVSDGEEALLTSGIPPAMDDPQSPPARDYVGRFAAALERLLADPPLAQALAARALARAHRDFSLESITARYLEIYRGVAGKPVGAKRAHARAR